MNRPLQRELFAQRPVRSDFARRRGGDGGGPGFNPRKLILVVMLAVAAIGIGIGVNMMGKSSGNIEEIPTIQADMPIKERPDQPGGIDIPHQNVEVFKKIDGTQTEVPAQNGVEHLLPGPEVPKPAPAGQVSSTLPVEETSKSQAPSVGSVPEPATASPEPDLPPAVTEADVPETPAVTAAKTETIAEKPAVKVTEPASPPAETPKSETKTVEKKAEPVKAAPVKAADKPTKVETHESQKAAQAMARLPKELFTNDNYAPAEKSATEPSKATTASQSVAESGKSVAVQLASVTDESSAKKMASSFQSQYAGILGGLTLRVERADLGSKGIYYRVKSGAVAETKAKAICADITKQKKGSCIVVK